MIYFKVMNIGVELYLVIGKFMLESPNFYPLTIYVTGFGFHAQLEILNLIICSVISREGMELYA